MKVRFLPRSPHLCVGSNIRKLPNGLAVAADVFNLLGNEVSDVDYYYASQLPGEPAPVNDIHFHPAEKRSVRLEVVWRY